MDFVTQGIYAGVFYQVYRRDGKLMITGPDIPMLIGAGGNPKLLQGFAEDRDPDDVVREFVESLPKKEEAE